MHYIRNGGHTGHIALFRYKPNGTIFALNHNDITTEYYSQNIWYRPCTEDQLKAAEMVAFKNGDLVALEQDNRLKFFAGIWLVDNNVLVQ